MNLSSELNQSCEELRLFGQQELSDNADLGCLCPQLLFLQLVGNGQLDYTHALSVISIFHHRDWLMFVFVCDRFCSVFIPFRYDTYRRKVTLLSLTALALAVINAVLAITYIIASVFLEIFGYVSVSLTRHAPILSFVSCSQ